MSHSSKHHSNAHIGRTSVQCTTLSCGSWAQSNHVCTPARPFSAPRLEPWSVAVWRLPSWSMG
eukprot:6458623-Lingulodinium_polyedra.AAC.1